eukprot:1150573-Pelagomonas_calceolata.AAC.8
MGTAPRRAGAIAARPLGKLLCQSGSCWSLPNSSLAPSWVDFHKAVAERGYWLKCQRMAMSDGQSELD